MLLPLLRRPHSVMERSRTTLQSAVRALVGRRWTGRPARGWLQTGRRSGRRLPLVLPPARKLPEVSMPAVTPRRWRLSDRVGVVFVSGVAAGALLMFLADPRMGRQRRRVLAEQVTHGWRLLTRDVPSWTRGRATWLSGHLGSLMYEAGRVLRGQPPYDDAVLADKVRAELGAAPEINVAVENGVVVLRGTLADKAQAEALVRRIRRIAGVRGVENLLNVA